MERLARSWRGRASSDPLPSTTERTSADTRSWTSSSFSGIVWEESRPQLANKAFLLHEPVGAGQIIAFAEDPNYRAYTEATQLLFMNAVLLGPGR